MQIRREQETGRPNEVDRPIRRRMDLFVRSGTSFRIGVTSDPTRNVSQHSGLYDEIVVLYKTGGQKWVRDMKRDLVNDYWNKCCNTVRGIGRPLARSRSYYLYVARAKGKNEMEVRWEYESGRPNEVARAIRKRVGELVPGHRSLTIGVTGDPKQKSIDWTYGYQGDDGSRVVADEYPLEMVVLYETTSEKYARAVEHDLINHFRRASRPTHEGTGSSVGGYYYVYVVRPRGFFSTRGRKFQFPIAVRCEVETGWPSEMIKDLRQRISKYVPDGRNKKIGITSKPPQRAKTYEREGEYDEMIVLYETNSRKFVTNMEISLIEHFGDDCDNKIGGGGGPDGGPPYHLYIVRD